jgi:hypothetical protein
MEVVMTNLEPASAFPSTITDRRATLCRDTEQTSQEDRANNGLKELPEEIKSCVAAGEDAKARAKQSKAQSKEAATEAKNKFVSAGELLIKAHQRTSNFKAFLKELGISRSRAYELIKIAGGDVEEVRAQTTERKRRQRARPEKAGVRDIRQVTDTPSDTGTGTASTPSETAEGSAEARKAIYAQVEDQGSERTDAGNPMSSRPDPGTLKYSEVNHKKLSGKDTKYFGEFKCAVDNWLRKIESDEAKRMALRYAIKISGLPLSLTEAPAAPSESS